MHKHNIGSIVAFGSYNWRILDIKNNLGIRPALWLGMN